MTSHSTAVVAAIPMHGPLTTQTSNFGNVQNVCTIDFSDLYAILISRSGSDTFRNAEISFPEL